MPATADSGSGMSGTRALFASIGASVLLVAAAALSLLAVSAVFAFGGWSDPVAQSGAQTPLILAGGTEMSRASEQTPLVLAPRERSRPTRSAARASAPSQPTARVEVVPPPPQPLPDPDRPQPPVIAEPQVAAPAPAAPKQSAGDSVRSVGDGLSGTVQSTGDALTQITDPLLPPVSAANQQVFDAVAELLRRSAEGAGGTVDVLLPAG